MTGRTLSGKMRPFADKTLIALYCFHKENDLADYSARPFLFIPFEGAFDIPEITRGYRP